MKLHNESNDLKISLADCFIGWSGIEWHLSILFERVINSSTPFIGHKIWDTLVSFRSKLDCLNGALNEKNISDESKNFWKKLYKKINSACAKRNKIAHGTFVRTLNDNENFHVIPSYSPHYKIQKEKFNKSYLEEVSLEFLNLSQAIKWYVKNYNLSDEDFSSQISLLGSHFNLGLS